jgi:hypothetical protein
MEATMRAYDDLCTIRGIGPARQRWLRNSFKIGTYEGLAGLSVDQIETQLKADGQIASRAAIKGWLAEAQKLAGQDTGHSSSRKNPSAKPVNHAANSIAREDGWEPFASFVIEFQARRAEGKVQETRTAIHHIESDTDTQWLGIESRQVCQWMVNQLPAAVREQGQEAQPRPKPAKRPVAEKLQITQARVLQPPQTSQHALRFETGQTFEGAVQGDHPFALEVDFELDVAAAARKAKGPIECCARSFAYEVNRRDRISLGETELVALEAGQPSYTLTLPQATLQHGTYRLWVVVTPKKTKFVHPGYVEVPAFQVT